MKPIKESATRLTLLAIVFTITILSIFAGGVAVWRGTLDETTKMILGLLVTVATLVVGFYFGQKNIKSTDEVEEIVKTSIDEAKK